MASVSFSEPSSDRHPRNSNGDDDDADARSFNSATTEMTMEEVVDAIGFGRFHWKLLFLCGVGYFAEITELVVVSFVAPSIQRQMGLSNVQYGLLGSSSFVGMAAGAFFWGYVSDHMGRQLSFALTVWLTFFGGFLSALAPNYAVLLLLRFVAAFGIGGMLPVDYTVFLEFLPAQKRGSYIVLVDAIGVVPALTLSATIAWYFAEAEHVEWRWVLVISSLPVGIMGVLRRHVPESPRYHLAAGETREAQRVVQEVADHNEVRLPDDWRLLSFQESLELEQQQQKQGQPQQQQNGASDTIGRDNTTSSRLAVSPLSTPANSPWSSARKSTTTPLGSLYAAVPAQQPEPECELAERQDSQSEAAPPEQPPPSSQQQQQQQGLVSYHNDSGVDGVMRNSECATGGGHSFRELVSDPELAGTTYRLWMCYFCVQLSSAGMVFALPKLFDETFPGKSESDIALDLLIGVVGLIPGLGIAFVAVEISRTRTLASFLVAAGISVILLGYTFVVKHNHVSALLMSIALRGAMEGCFAVLNTTAVESYPTLLRASGLGTAQIFDHIAGAFSPVLFSALNASERTRPWVFALYAFSYVIATVPALGLKEHAGDASISTS